MSELGNGGEADASTPSGGFLDELRRRGVAKAALIYAAVGWAVIEAASVIFPALNLPEWTVTFVVVLVLIGFPVTLVFAWVFDLTRGGVVRTPSRQELPASQAQALRRGRLLDFLVIAVLAGLVAWLGWDKMFGESGDETTAGTDSIAVLPFVNMSADPENEYFGDGLAEEILNALVGVSGLRVAARTSSFEYKGRNQDVRRIGAALGVANVLEGSVRRSGDRVRVTAQLIRSSDGFHLWSETYDGTMSDIFALQDEISAAITEALRPQLGAEAALPRVVRQTEDVRAYEAYLRGRHAMHKRTAESLNQALEDFRAAIDRDPGFAAAYSGLSDTYLLLSGYGDLDEAEARRLAEPMAQRALQLDPDLAEAQASWGLLLRDRRDYEGSLAPLQRAIELNPSYSPAYHWLGLSYQSLGRYTEANEVLRKTLEIDPQYVTGRRVLLGNLRQMGEDAAADEVARELERSQPNEINTLKSLMWDSLMRDPVRCARLALRVLDIEPASVDARNALSIVLGNIGDLDGARRQMEIAAGHDPDHLAVRFAPLRFAALERDGEKLRELLEALLPTIDNPTLRRELACQTVTGTAFADIAIAHCRAVLEDAGWAPGRPVPVHVSSAASALLMAAHQADDQALVAALEPELEALFDRLAAGGHSPFGLKMARIQIAFFRGDPEPLKAVLPEIADEYWFNVYIAMRDPMYAGMADDPRVTQAAAIATARMETARAELAALDLRVD